ncbi:alpha/beta hydrolase family protein [Conexibacter sp. SYSU D00693]|uniref:alpha/beta hydrolase n=1 Tax=Conexibacter sp. SYSU D00693 TaxID=2812560 RepID=UPI00196BACDB|nr:alpha/beta hydrolase family protein [Conexibacter sp. SYSU D00693]
MAIVAWAWASGATSSAWADAVVVAERRVSDRTIELTIRTDAFVAPTKVEVMFPVGYGDEPQRRWPVTYVTAGTSNRYTAFRRLLDGERLTQDYPSIVVAPDANAGYWSDWFNAGRGGPPKYETFVISQLIPLIDARYRTVPERRARAIFGISMGGYGAMMFAARHPDLFVAAASLSGAVDSNLPINGSVLSASSSLDGGLPDAIYGPRTLEEIRWRGHNPWDLAENLRGIALQIRTGNGTLNAALGEQALGADLLSCAVETGVHMASVNLHERFRELGVEHEWQDYASGCHSLPNFRRETVDALSGLTRALASPPPDPETVDFRSIEPRFEVFGWRVGVDPDRALEWMRLRANASSVLVRGSGRTVVVTPPLFRGLRAVDVDFGGSGRPETLAPNDEGRLRLVFDLGRPHRVQQFRAGWEGSFVTRQASLQPHALLRLSGVRRVRGGGLRMCARALGGTVPRARIVAGGRSVIASVGETRRCFVLRSAGRAGRVSASGRDGYGHIARAVRRLR